MNFMTATCELCRKDITKQNQGQFYECKNGTIEFIDLDGRQPWVGVNCLCNDCVYIVSVEFFCLAAGESDERIIGESDDN